jgi:hypothetical protein
MLLEANRVNRLRPKFPPHWAPEIPEGYVVVNATATWDACAEREFRRANNDYQRAFVVEEYVLFNARAAIGSHWLQAELSFRVFTAGDPVVRAYTRTLADYARLRNRYTDSPAIAQVSKKFRQDLLGTAAFTALWSIIRKHRSRLFSKDRKVSIDSERRKQLRRVIRNSVLQLLQNESQVDELHQLVSCDREALIAILADAKSAGEAATTLTANQFHLSATKLYSLWKNEQLFKALL